MSILSRFRRTPVPPISCQQLVEEVTAYLEGTLDAAERARLDVHLAACAGCAGYLEQMRVTLDLMGRMGPEDVSPAAYAELSSVFAAWRAEGAPAGDDPLA